MPLAQVDDAVEGVVAAVLSPALSVPLGPPDPDTTDLPAELRRTDGSSVYTVAGSRLFSSQQVIAAEQQVLALAQRTDGQAVSPAAVDRAVSLAAGGAGVSLNDGQVALVRDLATSGARVQLALAPAGTGKTTALRALAHAWTADGGAVLAMAPSAAAAAVLSAELNHTHDSQRTANSKRTADSQRTQDAGGERRVPADTLAKLLWSIDQLDEAATGPGGADRHTVGAARMPGWVRQVGPDSLVLIDEAGMAGTLDLARAVTWIVERGGSVRLVGDDQQLAAVGAGGVLRDLARTCGATTLHDVVRFTNPAEGPASLALPSGDPVALGFYLDRHRVHLADPTGALEQAYTAWAADRAAGRDSLLLAPTRHLAQQLNIRARTDRLAALKEFAGPEVASADGTQVSAGDQILTRRNDRRLVLSATDWVKNGDRWTVADVLPDGALQALHTRSRRAVRLPADYVAQHVTLGYASTIHTAQGSTADTSHTILTGRKDRQLLYVALTRGRTKTTSTCRRPPPATSTPRRVGTPCGPHARRGAHPHPGPATAHRPPPPAPSTASTTPPSSSDRPPPATSTASPSQVPACGTNAPTRLRPPTRPQAHCPGSQPSRPRSPSTRAGGPTWPDRRNRSATSPGRSTTRPAPGQAAPPQPGPCGCSPPTRPTPTSSAGSRSGAPPSTSPMTTAARPARPRRTSSRNTLISSSGRPPPRQRTGPPAQPKTSGDSSSTRSHPRCARTPTGGGSPTAWTRPSRRATTSPRPFEKP